MERFNSDDTLKETAYSDLSDVSPAQLKSASIAPQNNLIGASGTTIKFIFENRNPLPADGIIKVRFPLWNPDGNSNS